MPASYHNWATLLSSSTRCVAHHCPHEASLSWLAGRFYRRQFGMLAGGLDFCSPQAASIGACCSALSSLLFISIIFTSFRGDFGLYIFTLVWISPLFNEENPPPRRIYYALAGALVVSTTLYIQLAHRDSRIIIVIQCIVLLALGLADHLLLMSLRSPRREEADALRIVPLVSPRLTASFTSRRDWYSTVLSACSEPRTSTFCARRQDSSKGNLSVQLTRLDEAGLIAIEKVLFRKTTRTTVKLTRTGHAQLNEYWQTMKKIQEQGVVQRR